MRKLITAILVLVFVIPLAVDAKDLKLGYIHSQRILEEFQESQEAQRTLDDEQREWLTEAKRMEDEITALEKELENQSLLISEEKKAERIREIQKKYMEYQQYQQEVWGDTGRLFQRNKELTQPIIDKVNAVIHKLGEEGEYDVIFDAAVGNIVYAKEDFDMTDLVLEELNK
ncbi:OmpH family outer membrane protein [bacterium]|nr:OmpH family outer membrane protein [bacterium]MBU1881248.1 OmpH family outer membrane protein [bacterium]